MSERPTSSEAIRAEKLVKTFGHVTALNGVSMQVARGETLGILGDNGAGKSTLIKILTGYHQPDSGQVFVDGRPVELGSVDEARALGIECVYQDLALVNGLSIYHNMFLKRELLPGGPAQAPRPPDDAPPCRRRRSTRSASRSPRSISRSANCRAASARRSRWRGRSCPNARILLLDEPLAAMGAREARLIIDLIDRLKARGDIAIVMIAHNYAQTLEICDRVILIQHGEVTFESRRGRPRPRNCWRSSAANSRRQPARGHRAPRSWRTSTGQGSPVSS